MTNHLLISNPIMARRLRLRYCTTFAVFSMFETWLILHMIGRFKDSSDVVMAQSWTQYDLLLRSTVIIGICIQMHWNMIIIYRYIGLCCYHLSTWFFRESHRRWQSRLNVSYRHTHHHGCFAIPENNGWREWYRSAGKTWIRPKIAWKRSVDAKVREALLHIATDAYVFLQKK